MPRLTFFSPFSPLHRVFALMVKEFYIVLLDKKSQGLLFVAPFVMLFVFSFAVTMEVKNASLAVLNQDSGDLGRRFVSYFSSPEGDHPASGRPFAHVFRLDGVQDIRPAIENQRALMALHIPVNFSEKLESGQPASVQLILDGREINAAQIAAGYADTIARQFARTSARSGEAAPLDIAARYLFNPNQSYLWFTLPVLLAVLTQMIALVVSGMSVARERELGTLDQLLVSPLTSVEIVAGKTVPAALLAFGEGIVIHCVALTVFRVPFAGNLALLAVSFGLFILSVTGVGLFISSLCSTQQQAFLGCFTYMVPAVLLSGFVSPIENMPRALQFLTFLNPLRHTLDVVLSIYLKGAPVSDVLPEMIWLGGIAAATLTFSAWFFRKKTQ
ncbi:MAG: ABC transporter permease [Synergistaceae bacterium]|jgi:ABC-2 type transport system permease protein|nr:ABC transporter permease [Synergistaceae bacterium]